MVNLMESSFELTFDIMNIKLTILCSVTQEAIGFRLRKLIGCNMYVYRCVI